MGVQWSFVLLLLHADRCLMEGTFRGAVYEHAIIVPKNALTKVTRQTALDNMMKNLEVYKTQAELANRKGVDIIVFPENGLYGVDFSRESIQPYLEEIPDPEVEPLSPCTGGDNQAGREVQHYLSCLARNNSLYVVANLGDCLPCNGEPGCPPDGHHQYNTDVVYDKNGTLVAKYHKENLFFESQFDKPPRVEFVYFDTEFGRFGMFTCFDILFREPPIPLIESYNVTSIVFPTGWMDALPLLAAIEFHSAFSVGLGVNFLSANLHIPLDRVHGSGIYTPDGGATYFYDDIGQEGRLIVADIEIIERVSSTRVNPMIHKFIDVSEFKAVVFYDVYNMVELVNDSGQIGVCQRELCCSIEYKIAHHGRSEMYAFGVFDGLHTKDGTYYLQVCTLLKCLKNQRTSCGEPTKVTNTTFSYLKVQGDFSTQYVYPSVLTSDNGTLGLAVKEWRYDTDTLLSNTGISAPLLVAALVSRVYDRDMGVSMFRPGFEPTTQDVSNFLSQGSVMSVFALMDCGSSINIVSQRFVTALSLYTSEKERVSAETITNTPHLVILGIGYLKSIGIVLDFNHQNVANSVYSVRAKTILTLFPNSGTVVLGELTHTDV
ncbi:hypothetical protein ScPMuIL_008967 [Solemya velum]